MAKKEESGSGLRAGFSRADNSVPPVRKAAGKDETNPVKAPAIKPVETIVDPAPPVSAGEEHSQAPTITMQGVSGKKITGVVKVVKKVVHKPEAGEGAAEPHAVEEKQAAAVHPEPERPAVAAMDTPVSIPAPVPVTLTPQHAAAVIRQAVQAHGQPEPGKPAEVAPEIPVKTPEPVSAKVPEPAARIPEPEVPAAIVAVAAKAVVEPTVVLEQPPATPSESPPESQPESQPVSPAAAATTAAVPSARPQGPGGYAPRPQGQQGGYAPRPQGPAPEGGYAQSGYSARPQGQQGGYAPRPQGQDGGYAPRPQGQQGGYAPRPQGQDGGYAPRPQGPGGYAPRPQGQDGGYAPRPQGPGGYAPRPQGQDGGFAPRPQGPGGFAPRPQGQDGGYAPRPQGPGGYAPRPQGQDGGYAPRPQGPGGYAPRPQGQDGGYAPRPQGPGGYAPRPQGSGGFAPRPQGPGGYAPRPQGPGGYAPRPQGPGGYSPRPQGQDGGPRRSTGPDLPTELVGRPPVGRGSLTARDNFAKGPKRDDSKDARKAPVKNAVPSGDKHATLKQQTSTLPETGLSAVLTDETIMETIYSAPIRTNRQQRGGRRRERGSMQASQAAVQRAILTRVTLPDNLTVKEFAEAIKKTSADVIKRLMKMGVMATLNQVIDFDTAAIIASEFNITATKGIEVTEEDLLFDDTDDNAEDLVTRPPVVVVMGHVDHGKTSLLDRIRSTSVATGEAGGITQHIGAYMVELDGRKITFLDTPGHEAFTTMRARGAQVTDIAILVVAADDGVMPQTVEAINHARAANTQIVVAINKIDLPGANIDRVKQELATRELIPEEWGGTTIMVPVSAKTGAGIDDLLEMLLLTADILDLKSSPDKQAKGTIIEAKLDKSRGPVATLLVQRGTLNIGDTIVTGSVIGRVRAMSDYLGTAIKVAGPSTPVEITGLPEVPEAGEIFYAVTDEKVARALTERRRMEQREQGLRASSRMSLETLFTKMSAGEVKDINLIIKADVQGSVEAVRQSLEKLTTSEVRVNVIHGAVGAITEGDVSLAEVANAIIIGFNVRPAANVADIATERGVDLRMYSIIYNAIEDVQAAMKGMLTPVYKESILGHAEVRQVFKVTGAGTIAGCYVTDGRILRSAEARVVRGGVVVHEGKLVSLKRFKDDAREVATGYECGISIEKFNDVKEGDIIEAFEMKEIERA